MTRGVAPLVALALASRVAPVRAQSEDSAGAPVPPPAGAPADPPVEDPIDEPALPGLPIEEEVVSPPEAPDDGESFGDDRRVDLDEILQIEIVSATKIKQSVSEAPSAIAVVARDQVRAYGWTSLNDILYRQPGFAPARDYERRTVAGRGGFESWNNNHLLLLIDGIPFNDALYGSAYTWEITPLSIANTVEVSRGPGSALYGTNATNGVIAITTVSPAHLGTLGEARVRLGDRNTQIYDFLVADAWRHLSLTLGYNYYSTDGDEHLSYDGSGRTDGDRLAQFQVQDGRRSNYFFAKAEGSGALKGLSLQFHNQAWSFETGHGWLWWIPDTRESMDESRQIVALAYRREGRLLDQEYAVRFQRHNIDWNMRYFSNGATSGTFYPSGVSEYLNTSGDELFARVQGARRIRGDGSLLGGVEYTGFLYRGDDAHYANAALTDAMGGYPPTQGMVPLGPWFEWIEDRLVSNVGVYAQGITGGFLARRLNLTGGVRYDVQQFTYRDIEAEGRPDVSKTFQQVSPRAGLVITATSDLVIKLLAGRAFRAPSPSELFGANSWTLASNIRQLEPETIDTYELATELKLGSAAVVRGNGFYKSFANQIAYSVANYNLSTNLYSHDVVGIEAEVVAGKRLTPNLALSGFGNYSYVKLISEEVTDTPIAESDHLTWSPSQWGNAGIDLRFGNWETTSQLHVQGPVRRRASDRMIEVNRAYRPAEVAAWATIDARLAYRPRPWIEVSVQATNVADAGGYLVKNNDYPFDYRIEPRRFLAVVDVQVR